MAREKHMRWVVAVTAAVLFAALDATVSSHEKKAVGGLQLTIGWGDEPVFTGARNAVEVRVADAGGVPVTAPDASLTVEVSFGDERITLPLVRTREASVFKAWLLPNRPGTYTFHITGKVKEQTIDTTSTCSDTTFDCVVDLSTIQFPAKDPSIGQLADRVSRALPRAERAGESATSARLFAIVAAVAAAAALVFSLVALNRSRRTGS